MPTQLGLDGHMRMVELADELHIEALHDGARSLSSVTLSPIGFGKAPAHFHAGKKWKLVGRSMQSNEADELAGRAFLNRPEPPASLVDEHKGKHRSGIGLVATLKLEREKKLEE